MGFFGSKPEAKRLVSRFLVQKILEVSAVINIADTRVGRFGRSLIVGITRGIHLLELGFASVDSLMNPWPPTFPGKPNFITRFFEQEWIEDPLVGEKRIVVASLLELP